jgi:serine phosphatase RsbU (regulator of sigma subunit)
MKKKFTPIFRHVIAISIVTFVVLGAGIIGYMLWQTHQHRDMVAAARDERQDMAERIWKAKSENFQNAVRDNSAWDDLVDFTENFDTQPIDSAWLDDNFGFMLDAYTASMVAIFDANGRQLYTKIADGYKKFDFFSLDFLIFSNKVRDNGLTDFYMYKDEMLMEFFGATITSSADNDHKLKPKGFLLLCREISDDVIEDYRMSVGAKSAKIAVKYNVPTDPDDGENIVISKEFNNYNNAEEAVMCSVFENSVEKFFDEMKPVFGIFALLCIVAMANIIFFMRGSITEPLAQISKSLSTSDPTAINDLTKSNNEFGQIATMLQEFYMQQEEVKIQNETLVLQSEEINAINDDLSQQKNRLAEVNHQITDSISYAGRIQRSAVTQLEVIDQMFPDNMVIYLPRNIVSGDWYYVAQHHNKKIIVEADCTGHGVPGSLLSMLGISALKDILNLMEINGEAIMPETVLERMRATIKNTLIKQNDDIMSMNDGMDMSIGVLENDNSSMRFAGANQSLFVMRNAEIIKLKGNRMPIGNYVRETPFEGVDFALQKGDALFFMSDGIKDQISNEMEKFKWMRLEAFLIEHSKLPLAQVGAKLIQTVMDWKGEMEQVDDMTMLGVRV